jgi:hypothetical protein
MKCTRCAVCNSCMACACMGACRMSLQQSMLEHASQSPHLTLMLTGGIFFFGTMVLIPYSSTSSAVQAIFQLEPQRCAIYDEAYLSCLLQMDL